MSRFVAVDRDTAYLLPPSVNEWLPANHLARFVVEVIEQLDLSALTRQYGGRGSAAHHPAVLLGLLVYGYASGVHSSRKIERATYDSVAFRFVAANTHPDHDTLATFRRRFLKEIETLFVQVLVLAREMKLLKLGHIALDGTKIDANASKHKALSWAHANKIEAQLRQEVQTLLALAENSDTQAVPDGMDVPAEIARREDRLNALAQAKAKIEQRAAERHQREQQEFDAKVAKRQAQREEGKKPRGKDPEPPQDGPKDTDQVNLTDEESRIMPVSGGGFEQSYNAQAGVDTETMLVVTAHVSQACNDKREVQPTIGAVQALPEVLGQVQSLIADNGYCSQANAQACNDAGIAPLLAIKRESHHMPVMERFAPDGPPPETTNPLTRMVHQLGTKAGRALYKLRKQTVEPVFGAVQYVAQSPPVAMFAPGRILHIGAYGPAAGVVDIRSGTPTVTATESMRAMRHHGVGTVLADGRVLASGGGTDDASTLANAVLDLEVWNPVTGEWTLGPKLRNARLYHGTALLLPDARVLVAGGGVPGPLFNTNGEIYTPPYLYGADGQLAARPAITQAPTVVEAGQAFQIKTSTAAISRVTFVRFGSTSHTWSADQRFLDLPIRRTADGLSVQLPARATDTPPGFYLLFAFDDKGVPSVAQTVRVNVPGARDAQAPVVEPIVDMTWTTGAVAVQPQGRSPTGRVLTWSAAGLPPGLSIDPATGAIAGTPAAGGDHLVTVAADDGVWSGSATFLWKVSPPAVVLQPPTPPAPTLAGQAAAFHATAAGAGLTYSWNFGDGSHITPDSPDPHAVHTYSAPGLYTVTVTVYDARRRPVTQSFLHRVTLPVTAQQPTRSTMMTLAKRSGGELLWVANPDANTVALLDPASMNRHGEVRVGARPVTLAEVANGQIWVVNREGASITVIDGAHGQALVTLPLPPGSLPHGIAMDPTGRTAYVALEATGQLLRFDTNSRKQTGSVAVGASPRRVAVRHDGAVVYVSRFITPAVPAENGTAPQVAGRGGEVVRIDAAHLAVANTIVLAHSERPDAENQGRGLPNNLGAMAISPDGSQPFVPSKQDNLLRGTRRDGRPLDFQNTVRAVSSRIVMHGEVEDGHSRIDHDNASLASAAAFDPSGALLFVALKTSREVAIIDAHQRVQRLRVDTGLAPQAVQVSADGQRLFVANFMDRSVTAYDLSALSTRGQPQVPRLATTSTVGAEPLAPNLLRGKQLFYDARDTRLARDRYMSCATCHADGGHDGRTWDISNLGEGVRNTPTLRGRAALGQGPLHRSGNFDEVQDFEGQIRRLAGGTGLLSDAQMAEGNRSHPLGLAKAGLAADLDALAAYVGSLAKLDDNPNRALGAPLTAQALAGREVFTTSCVQCHGGAAGTGHGAGGLMNVGTLTPASGQRLGEHLAGVAVPMLRGLWATAPYLHDGSAPTIETAVTRHVAGLTPQAVSDVAAFVRQADLATEVPDTVMSGAARVALAGVAAEPGPGHFDLTPAINNQIGAVSARQRWSTTQAWRTTFELSLQRRAEDGLQADGVFLWLQAGPGGTGGDVTALMQTWTYNTFGLNLKDRPAPAAGLPLGQARSITGSMTVSWDPATRRLLQVADLVVDGVHRQLRDEAEVDLAARLGPTMGVQLYGFTGSGRAAQSVSNWRVRFGAGLQAPAVHTVGSASAQPGGGFVLTPEAMSQAGAVWRQQAVPTGLPFESRFRFRLTNSAGNLQADGLAFVLQPNGPRALGGAGGCLGMCNLPGWVAAALHTWDINSAGLEFDNRRAPQMGGALEGAARVIQGTMTVRWDPGQKRLSMRAEFTADGQPRVAEDAVTVDLAARFGPTVTAGITAATGGGIAGQSISEWTITASPPLASPMTACAGEGGTCHLPAGLRAHVYYGANGKYAVRTDVSGTFGCDNTSFGADPVPGVVKSCGFVASNTVKGTVCAGEGGFCALPAGTTGDVYYGAGGRYAVRAGVTGVQCGVAQFGGDPNVGVPKFCSFVVKPLAQGADLEAADSVGLVVALGVPCAGEGGTCAVPAGATATVVYGADGRYASRQGVTGSISCSPDSFGGDPAYGVLKSCKAVVNVLPPAVRACANDFGACTVPAGGARTVFYGQNGTYLFRSLPPGGFNCLPDTFFGIDPAFGVTKSCLF